MSPEFIAIAMFVVLVVFLFMGHPLAFVLGGVGFLFGFFTQGWNFFGMVMTRIYSTMDNFVLVAITLFILMGNFLTMSGVADELFKALRVLFGPIRGGVGLAVIAVCIVFAACTGIIGASVVTMGLLAGPFLLRYGYSKELTMGMVAAGGSLGILIPPSIMLVMMADQTGQSAGKLLMAGVVPGVLLGILYMIYIAVICWIKPEMGPAIPKEELAQIPVPKRIIDTLKFALPPLALILAVLGAIFFGVATPTEAAAVGSAASFLMIIIYRKFEWRNFKDTIFSTGKTVTMVITILIGATTFTGVFLTQGGGKAMVDTIMALGLGPMGTYWMMMIIYVILGCFIDWIGIIFIMIPLVTPIGEALGFNKLWFAMMIIVNLQMSFLTPPFAYALFYLRGIAQPEWGIETHHIVRGVIPFILLIMVGLFLCIVFPDIILGLPKLLSMK